MQTKYTPGPWDFETTDEGTTDQRTRVYGAGILVADLFPPVCQEETPMVAANARLIAAAPELLAALGECERALRWAAQEAQGRVRAEIVVGWLHHAQSARALLARLDGGQL